MGTTTLEAKLIQQLTSMTYSVLHKIFLDLQKEYYTLDWYRCLEIIAVYGVGPRVLRVFQAYQGRITMVDKTGGYFDTPPSMDTSV